MPAPVVKKDEKGIPTLYVHGKPFFCYSGEIHNSSASDPAFMEQKVWPALEGLHMNSVITAVYWELIEEKEGVYDFRTVDSLIEQAREHGMRLILLWFGLWKNAESMYVPAWMKKDTETYFRAEKITGEKINTISPLCQAAVEKDARAFAALCAHIRQLDEEENTVLFIQVENEIGLLGTERDYGRRAEELFQGPVPKSVMKVQKNLSSAGKEACTDAAESWKTVYGDDAEEVFMAWAFSSAVEKITSAGKKEYDLPCYANSWLKQYPWYAGSYPMGGPVPEVHAVWKAMAPSLFALAPDIYVPYCADVMDKYGSAENPLFIPEIRKDAVTTSYCIYAFGAKNAIGYSPFGIEDLALDPSQIERPPMEVMIALNIDPSAFDTQGSREYLAQTYRLLKNLEPLTLQYRSTEHMKSFVRHGENDNGTLLHFQNFDVLAAYAPRQSGKPLGAGVIIEQEDGSFLILATNVTFTFRVKVGEAKTVGILRYEEGELTDGVWKAGRVLNGDEEMSVRFGDMPEIRRLELYKY